MTFPERMTFDGDWRPALDFIARAYKDSSSVRSSIEGERNIQGFFTAYLSINAYYLTMPEVELSHGFCDKHLFIIIIYHPLTKVLTASLYCNRNRGRERLR